MGGQTGRPSAAAGLFHRHQQVRALVMLLSVQEASHRRLGALRLPRQALLIAARADTGALLRSSLQRWWRFAAPLVLAILRILLGRIHRPISLLIDELL